ncbi:hypothetical protein [Nostoc flagelliforme]|nr:hypothetical protein [Nostoc flagelliforme]
MTNKTISTIEVSSDVYMQIIAGKAVIVNLPFKLNIGKEYKIINSLTKTYMKRRLKGILGDYFYWEVNR